MKALPLLTAIVLVGLSVGCSQEEDLALPSAKPAVVGASALSLEATPSTPPTSLPARPAEQIIADKADTGQSSEESAADISRSEKVYQLWNDALAEFRAKNSRLPRSIQELEQFKPSLASHKPAAGFRLEIYPQFNSIEFAPVKTTTSASYRP